MLDILIRNGWVADGTGNPTYRADVAIEGERIVDVRPLDEGATARRIIDAAGKIVCPGFIDSHSHSDRTIHGNPTAESTIRQGTTTEIVGHCGSSCAPLSDLSREGMAASLRGLAYDGPMDWSTFAEYLASIARRGVTPNLAHFVGHNTLRNAVGCVGTTPTREQIDAMKAMVAEAMEAGAIGMSTGLEFAPGRLASIEEVVELAQVVGRYGGVYASHIRNRAKVLQAAMDEFVEIVRRSGTVGQVSHLNVRYNTGAPPNAWEEAVETLYRARAEGLQVAGDCTPFTDGTGGPAAILPPWLIDGGPERAADLLDDPEVRARVRTECDRYWAFIQRGDWDRVRILRSERFPELVGLNFYEIAEDWDKEPWDCLFDLFQVAFRGQDHIGYIGRLFTEEHVAAQVSCPLLSLSVDGSTTRIDGPLADLSRHPLSFCGMVHFLTYWVREKGVLRLEEAIRKMTSMPATQHGLTDRGLLHKGCFADVVVFDYGALDDVSTLEEPLAYVRGVEHVTVNGVLAVDASDHTGARPGRSL